MKRHRRRRDRIQLHTLERGWCSECQTYTLIVDGTRRCHEYFPGERPRTLGFLDPNVGRHIRRCAWQEGQNRCPRLTRARNGKWCAEHARRALRRAKLAYYHRTKALRPPTRTSPALGTEGIRGPAGRHPVVPVSFHIQRASHVQHASRGTRVL
jgi:hypothetical protein